MTVFGQTSEQENKGSKAWRALETARERLAQFDEEYAQEEQEILDSNDAEAENEVPDYLDQLNELDVGEAMYIPVRGGAVPIRSREPLQKNTANYAEPIRKRTLAARGVSGRG